MPAPVIHVEIGSNDTAATADFYRSVFGWQTIAAGPARMVTGGNEGGASVMLNSLGHPPENYVMAYIQVDDLDATLLQVGSAGGTRLVGPVPLPDGRRFAWIEDNAGNMIAVITPLP